MNKKEEYKQRNIDYIKEVALQPGIATLPEGALYKVIKSGEGVSPIATNVISVYYKGSLINGRVFDSNLSQPCPEPFRLSEVIKGWQIALPRMRVGDTWEIYLPASLGYGSKGVDGIPRNSTLIFEITLVNVF